MTSFHLNPQSLKKDGIYLLFLPEIEISQKLKA